MPGKDLILPFKSDLEASIDEQAEEYDKLLSGTQDDFFDVYTDYTDNDLKG